MLLQFIYYVGKILFLCFLYGNSKAELFYFKISFSVGLKTCNLRQAVYKSLKNCKINQTYLNKE